MAAVRLRRLRLRLLCSAPLSPSLLTSILSISSAAASSASPRRHAVTMTARSSVSLSLLLLVSWSCAALCSPIRGSGDADAASPVYIWPLPQSVTSGSVLRSVSFPLSVTSSPTFPDMDRAIARFLSTNFLHRAVGDSGVDSLSGLSITVRDINAPLQLYVDESYSLVVPSDPQEGQAELYANTLWGALHGLETFSQLLSFNFTSSLYQIPSTPWRVKDFPRFSHRGMLVDTSRHYQDIPILHRIIDSLTYAKYNVFHWHLSDIQSLPYQSDVLPRLSMAAYSPQERYSTADIADLVEYARQRGVRVMIEFDVPGHAASWCVGYPEVCPSPDCTMPLDPSSNATFDLMRLMWTEVTGGRSRAGLVPEDLFHLGGDEVDLGCWTSVPHVAAWLRANNLTDRDAYRYMVEAAHEIVYSYGRTPVNWDEVWANFGRTIDPQTIIHVWRDESYVQNATRDGFRVLVSPDGPWYLDGLDTTWQDMYALEPATGITDAKQAALVLGGESTMWGETVDASVILPTIWPRAAAVAERLWSAVTVTDAVAAEPRYAWFRCLLDQRGIEAGPYSNKKAREAPSGPGGCLSQ